MDDLTNLIVVKIVLLIERTENIQKHAGDGTFL